MEPSIVVLTQVQPVHTEEALEVALAVVVPDSLVTVLLLVAMVVTLAVVEEAGKVADQETGSVVPSGSVLLTVVLGIIKMHQ